MMGSFLEAIAKRFYWLFCASVDKHVQLPPSKSLNEEFGRKLNYNLLSEISSTGPSWKFVTEQIYSLHLRCHVILIYNVIVIVLIKHLCCQRQAILINIKLVTANHLLQIKIIKYRNKNRTGRIQINYWNKVYDTSRVLCIRFIRLFQAYFGLFYYHFSYASLVGSFDFCHRRW